MRDLRFPKDFVSTENPTKLELSHTTAMDDYKKNDFRHLFIYDFIYFMFSGIIKLFYKFS